jgi:hypothetical protein
MFAKPPFTYFEVTSHPNTFCKNNPRFFYNYKNTLFTCTLNFQKLHMNIHKLYINNTYFTLTVNMSSLQVHELSQTCLKPLRHCVTIKFLALRSPSPTNLLPEHTPGGLARVQIQQGVCEEELWRRARLVSLSPTLYLDGFDPLE